MNENKKAINLLKKYYLPHSADGNPSDTEKENAIAAGVFVPDSVMTHDEIVSEIKALSEQISIVDTAKAFLYSLSSGDTRRIIMNRKFAAVIVAASLTITALAGCNTAENNTSSEGSKTGASTASSTDNEKPALEKTSFNLGHLNSTAHLLGFVAKEEGYFEEEGLDVTLTLFSSAAELSIGLESDKLDVAFIGSVPSITFQSKGHDLTIFGGAMTNGHGYVIKPQYVEGLDKWDVSILKGRNVASVKRYAGLVQ